MLAMHLLEHWKNEINRDLTIRASLEFFEQTATVEDQEEVTWDFAEMIQFRPFYLQLAKVYIN